MFERLAGKLLSRFLSKYFVQQDSNLNSQKGNETLSNSKSQSSSNSQTQLGVWSGYIALENLVLKEEFINNYFRGKGLPFELLKCTFQRVEITIPWGKLGTGSGLGLRGQNDASVVVVIDGVYILLTSNYEYDDDAMESSRLVERRSQLDESESFVRQNYNNPQDMDDTRNSGEAFSGIASFLKKKLTEGILNEIIEKFHLHLRDVHIRLEDAQSDHSNPFTCGITLESLHIHSDDAVNQSNMAMNASSLPDKNIKNSPDIIKTLSSKDAIHKIMQVNCLSIYWCPLHDSTINEANIKNIPKAWTMFSKMQSNTSSLSRAMQECIIRRSDISSRFSTSLSYSAPVYAYLLLPINASCHILFAKDPNNLLLGPVLKGAIYLESFSLELRDYQLRQIIMAASTMQNYKQISSFRRYRPKTSVKENPKAWWIYAIKIMKMKLREKETRWSWHRFAERCMLRKEYTNLYKRKIIAGVQSNKSSMNRIFSNTSLTLLSQGSDLDDEKEQKQEFENVNDPNKDSSIHQSEQELNNDHLTMNPLTPLECETLQSLDDGTKGDLTVLDIMIFRAMAHAQTKLHQSSDARNRSTGGRLSEFVKKMIGDDSDAEEEYLALLAYLEKKEQKELYDNKQQKLLTAISLEILIDKGSIGLLSQAAISKVGTSIPGGSIPRLQRFLELSFSALSTTYELFGDYSSYNISASLLSCEGSEIFANGTSQLLFGKYNSRRAMEHNSVKDTINDIDTIMKPTQEGDFKRDKLLDFKLVSHSDESEPYDIIISAQVEIIEFTMKPNAQWFKHIKAMFASFPSQANTKEYWENMRMAFINSWDSKKAELQAKTGLALFQRKAVGLNLLIRAPIISISDESGTTLSLDLGTIDISTKQLAGFTSQKFRSENLTAATMMQQKPSLSRDFEQESVGNSSHESGTQALPSTSHANIRDEQSVSNSIGLDSFSFEPTLTITSFERIKRRRSRLHSISHSDGDQSHVHTSRANMPKESLRNIWKSCFYDIFEVQVKGTKVTLHVIEESDNNDYSILHNMDMKIILEKSVIPADHTLSRIKTSLVVEELNISFPTTCFIHFCNMLKSWNEVKSQASNLTSNQLSLQSDYLLRKSSEIEGIKLRRESTDSNDLEFFDALDQEEMNGDDWLEDNRALDSEDPFGSFDFISEEGKFSNLNERGLSDLTSKGNRHQRNSRPKVILSTYLSEENLARWGEETLVERTPKNYVASESGLSQISAESFHSACSAFSFGDQTDLTHALQNEIKIAEEEVNQLKKAIKEVLDDKKEKHDKDKLSSSEEKHFYVQLKKNYKLELLRSEAELGALRSLYKEIMTELASVKPFNDNNALGETNNFANDFSMKEAQENLDAQTSTDIQLEMTDSTKYKILQARSLLHARSMKAPNKSNFVTQHNLTSTLNRDNFFGSFTIKNFTIEIIENSDNAIVIESEECSPNRSHQLFMFYIGNINVHLHHYSFESRLSLSIESIFAVDKISDKDSDPAATFFSGEGIERNTDYFSPLGLPSDKFLRVTIEHSHKNGYDNGKSHSDKPSSVRLKCSFGKIVACFEQSTIRRIFNLVSFIQKQLPQDSRIDYDEKNEKSQNFLVTFHDKFMNVQMLKNRIVTKGKSDSNSYFAIADFSLNIHTCEIKVFHEKNQLLALVMDRLKIRLFRAVSPIILQNKGQIGIRLKNFHLFEFSDVDQSLSTDIVTQQEIARSVEPLLQIRLRSQLVPISEYSGWTVERETSNSDRQLISSASQDEVVWNVHIGSTFKAIQIKFSINAIKKLQFSMNNFRDIKESSQSPFVIQKSKLWSNEEKSEISTTILQAESKKCNEESNKLSGFKMRFRMDLKVEKTRLILQNDDVRDNMIFSCDLFHLCLQQNASNTCSNLDIYLHDICFFRDSNHWMVLEPLAFILACSLLSKKDNNVNEFTGHIDMPIISKWHFKEREDLTLPSFDRSTEETNLPVRASFSPIQLNLSSKILTLIICWIDTNSHPDFNEKTNEMSNHERLEERESFESNKAKYCIYAIITLPSAYLYLKKETKLSSGHYRPDPLSLLTMESFTVTFSSIPEHMREGKVMASLSMGINLVTIFDLSCLPAIQVIGPQISANSNTDRDSHILLQLSMEENNTNSQEFFTLHVSLTFGNTQFLVLPSIFEKAAQMIREIQTHQRVEKSSKKGKKEPDKRNSTFIHSLMAPHAIRCVYFNLKNKGFQLLLPTRDVTKSRLESEPTNVVAVRWDASLDSNACLCFGDQIEFSDSSITGFNNLDQMIAVNQNVNPADEVIESWDKWKKHYQRNENTFEDSMALSTDSDQGSKLKSIVAVSVNFKLENFQILRTCITQKRISGFAKTQVTPKRNVNPNSSHKQRQESQHTFVVTPPLAGEQQIISPLNFHTKYSSTAISLNSFNKTPYKTTLSSDHDDIYFAHAFQVEVGFIDIMVYILQGSEGINEALKVSLVPILDAFKHSDSSIEKKKKLVTAEIDEITHHNDKKSKIGLLAMTMRPSFPTQKPLTSDGSDNLVEQKAESELISILRKSVLTFSVRVTGIQATCVPGGATRLTEAPIMKCSVVALKFGGALLPVPNMMAATEESSVKSDLSCLEMACWISCNISSHYHNRRLVAWEPVIESWGLNARLGANLSKFFDLQRQNWIETQTFSPLVPVASQLQTFDDSFSRTWNKNRMRDIGRRLLSMNVLQDFKDNFDEVENSPHDEGQFECISDLPHILLHLISPDSLSSSIDDWGGDGVKDSLVVFPGRKPYTWLRQHGYPSSSTTGEQNMQKSSLNLAIRDANPLNINLTSALIENISGYLSHDYSNSNPSPHLIRNNCGVPIRFMEVLDSQRIERGEKAQTTFLDIGEEVSLSLKRRISQTCDPHQAHLYVEIDHFSTFGLQNANDKNTRVKPSSLASSFRVAGRVPVDMVGVYEFSLQRIHQNNILSQFHNLHNLENFGVIIVRVALIGGAKVVSIESPLMIKNTSDTTLCCTLKDKSNHEYWKAIIHPQKAFPVNNVEQSNEKNSKLGYVPIPPVFLPSETIDFLSFHIFAIHDSYLKAEQRFPDNVHKSEFKIRLPEPYSKTSTGRGVIKESDMKMQIIEGSKSVDLLSDIHFNLCSLRIGNFTALEKFNMIKSELNIPEQRMLLIRSPFAIRNHLPVKILVQIRRDFSKLPLDYSYHYEDGWAKWESLGILKCGETVNWGGALSSESIEFRIRLVEDEAMLHYSSSFPSFSEPVIIPSRVEMLRLKAEKSFVVDGKHSSNEIFTLDTKVLDKHGIPLNLSVSLEEKRMGNIGDSDSAPHDDVSAYASVIPPAARVVAIHVPFWIIDETGMDIEFKSDLHIGGQVHKDAIEVTESLEQSENISFSGGLSGMLYDTNRDMESSFFVHMIGDINATKLCIRRFLSKTQKEMTTKNSEFPWSDPIPLKSRSTIHHLLVHSCKSLSDQSVARNCTQSMALNCRILAAPDTIGGKYGTRLVHVVNRYNLFNLLGRDIEVMIEDKKESGLDITTLSSEEKVAFHFDDKNLIRIRPKEYGWSWSGRFSLKKKRRETFVRLRNKITSSTIIVNIEFEQTLKNHGTTLVSFQSATRPPFRIENETLHPLHFYQDKKRFISAPKSTLDLTLDILLPYHSAPYSWDEPDEKSKSLLIEMADFSAGQQNLESPVLGNFYLDQLAPGLSMPLSHQFSLDVTADGPIRVFRLTDSSLPTQLHEKDEDEKKIFNLRSVSEGLFHPYHFDIKFAHGIGISVVDSDPKEILYVRFEDIFLDLYVTESSTEIMELAIGSISIDNQLWVTPFPVLLKVGSRSSRQRKIVYPNKRKQFAVNISWCREINSHSMQDDGLVLLRSLQLSLQPMILRIDGNLIDQLMKMYFDVSHVESSENDFISKENGFIQSRDAAIRAVLEGTKLSIIRKHESEAKIAATFDSSHVDPYFQPNSLVITGAMAAKSYFETLKNISSETIAHDSFRSTGASSPKNAKLTQKTKKYQKKIYIEKLKISSIKADLSWNGPLPAFFNLPTFIRPALTFEGFPIMLRAYSINHAYDTAKEHLQNMKSHYINIGRIFDLVMGLVYKPTLIIRATLYTSRYYTASSLESFSKLLFLNHERLSGLIKSELESITSMNNNQVENPFLPTTFRKIIPKPSSRRYYGKASIGHHVIHDILNKAVKLTAGFLRSCSYMTSMAASMLSYNNRILSNVIEQSNLGDRDNIFGDFMRLRPPRLFANQDGKDLLVEHVEGTNVGKALLSRVQLGMYLGEGYIYHSKGLKIELFTANNQKLKDENQDSLILMITGKRLLILKDVGNLNFCPTIWEVTLNAIALIEIDEKPFSTDVNLKKDITKNVTSGHNDEIDNRENSNQIQIWYLARSNQLNQTSVDNYYSNGLGSLHHISMAWKDDEGKQFLSQLFNTEPKLATPFFTTTWS